LAISKYQYNNDSVQSAINELVEAAKQADVIFIPDGGNSPVVIARQLKRAGVDLSQKLLMGTGQWRNSNLSAPDLQGAIFADMDQTRFEVFKQRYAQRYGSEPTVNAALGYDAVLLVGGLLRENPGRQITRTEIERRQGFIGASGVFRFLANGRNERGLAIFKVENGKSVTIQASPSSF
jgi:branched-chain amino acid transport system substrate-binding protein